MAITIRCPGCEKALRVVAAAAGKRLRCPLCQQVFAVPAVDDELSTPSQQLEFVQEDDPVERDRPRRRRREPDDEDEDEEPERPRRRKRKQSLRDGRNRDQISPSSTPLVLGILAITCACAPIIGFVLGSYAMTKANAELDRLPRGRRYRHARTHAQVSKILGIAGMVLSVILFVVAIVFKVVSPR